MARPREDSPCVLCGGFFYPSKSCPTCPKCGKPGVKVTNPDITPEHEVLMRQRIAEEIRSMVNDYPTDVFPIPDVMPTDAQSAYVLRIMLPCIARRIDNGG